MPSPFPGMDPYLEYGGRWPDMHQRLITYTSEWLRPQLRPKYIARIEERIELRPQGKEFVPDIMVVERPRQLSETQVAYGSLVADEPQTIRVLDEERRVPYIQVVKVASGEVVTLIEVLSPSNKIGRGREQYIEKQDEILNTPVNLVEIDLLSRPTATYARYFELHSPHDWRYIISISRPQRRTSVEVYAFPLRERLPRCKIPLLPEDSDAVLDLPAVYARCYEIGDYDLLLDYGKPPPVSLSKAEEEWMEALLLEKGLRTAPVQQ